MRTIIAGSRGIVDMSVLRHCIDHLRHPITVVISGAAIGVDSLAIDYAKEHELPLEMYPAEWKRFGNRAGFIRNELMASKAEALVAIWDGKSRGTRHMITVAKMLGLTVTVYRT